MFILYTITISELIYVVQSQFRNQLECTRIWKYPISANIFLINHHSMLPLIICNFHVMSLSQQSVFSLLCNLYRNVMVWYYHIPPMTQWIQRKLNSSTIKSSNVAFPIQGDKMDACGIRTYRGHESLERLIMTVRILTSHL